MRLAPAALLGATALFGSRAVQALSVEDATSLKDVWDAIDTEEAEAERLGVWATRAKKPTCEEDSNCRVDSLVHRRDGKKKRIVVTQVNRGRLGNHLFQWAALLSIAKEGNFEVVVRNLKYKPANTAQMRGLSSLVWEAQDYATLEQQPNLCHVWDQTPVVVDTGLPRLGVWTGWGQEKGAAHIATGIDPMPGMNWAKLWADAMVNTTLPDGTLCETWELDGFFQDQWFFMDHMDLVREAFWHEPTALQAAEILKWLMYNEKGPSVGIHIRLGDYKYTNRNMPIQYYKDALDAVKARDPDKSLTCLILSDDIEEALEVTAVLDKCDRRVPVPPDLGEANSFYMLGLMPNIIIADSSFSFWAARLSPHEPFVVAPGISKDRSEAQSAYEYLLHTPGWKVVNTTTDMLDIYKNAAPADTNAAPAVMLAMEQHVYPDAAAAAAARNPNMQSEWAY